ncbi:MAG TPA: NAD(P)-dependent oxidoreductase [Gaiella sp.]|nr:NAD(P)-dependent oxidoreductase [Gaiella sp.]
MKVLVTGSSGYVGSVLWPIFVAHGHDVVGLDTGFYDGCDFGTFEPEPERLTLDVRDVEPRQLEGFDAVVHLAALSNDPLGDLSPDLTYAINHRATVSLARAAKVAGVRRFVFASSCSMYGASGEDALLAEDAPLRPLTPYAESKVRSEAALPDFDGDGFSTVAMRNATVYGVSPRLRLDIVLNNLAAWGHVTGKIRLLSDGRSWRPLLHVRDLAKVAVRMVEAPSDLVGGKAFNIGSGAQNYVVRDLAEMLAEVTGCDLEFASDASPDPRSYRVDFSALERAFPDLTLDWDARRGAEELVGAYREIGLTPEAFEGRPYVRLRQLRHLLDEQRIDDDLRWVAT